MNAFKRFFFNLFLCCFGFGLLFFVKLDSYADVGIYESHGTVNNAWRFDNTWNGSFLLDNERYAFYVQFDGAAPQLWCSVDPSPLNVHSVSTGIGGNSSGGISSSDVSLSFTFNGTYNCYVQNYNTLWGFFDFTSNVPIFSDLVELSNYLHTGRLPELPFDETLELDYFRVSPYGFWDNLLGTPQDVLSYDYKYDIGWSDSRITTVKLRIDSTRATNDFTSSLSPFRGSFKGSTYANQNGDVVRLIATPYKSDGSYGVSLYYSFVQDNNTPLVNIWRKLFKNNHTDNTIDIPYNGNDISLPVDGVGTVNNYKVNYNPVTNEYGDLNLYEVYYQPVIIYEIDTPQEEIEDTQNEVVNNYVTNNYNEIIKNINLGFDINFGDISSNDITDTFDNFGNFGNGFGSFINKLASWVQLIFPFLSSAVAAAIVSVFGLVLSLAIIALILKIAGVIADIIPF